MNALDGKSHGKHIFVFSAAGKPIFSRQGELNHCRMWRSATVNCISLHSGDEQDLVTIFGLLQAVPSIVNDSGDHLRLIKAGPTRILYMFQKSLYFAAVSSSTESEAALLAQLYFLYNQILFILTAKVISYAVFSYLELSSSAIRCMMCWSGMRERIFGNC